MTTTVAALSGAARDARLAWRPRSTAAAVAFAIAAFAPLVFGDSRTADLANGLYLAAAAVGLALVVGVAGLPLLAQGGFVAVGATVSARLLEHGVRSPPRQSAGQPPGQPRAGSSASLSRDSRARRLRPRPGSSRGRSPSRCSR